MIYLKALLAVALAASLAANIYLARTLIGDGGYTTSSQLVFDQPVVMHTKGGLLEVSVIKHTEQFESNKEHKILGVSMGNTFTRIRVPAVYRYHIELAPEWKILLRDKTFIVVAPPVKPSLPVSIDTALLERESFGVWATFKGASLLDQLQRSITPALAEKAVSPTYIQLQRVEARKAVAEFVSKWLITQEEWKAASSYPIRAFFADEPIQVLGNTPLPIVGVQSP